MTGNFILDKVKNVKNWTEIYVKMSENFDIIHHGVLTFSKYSRLKCQQCVLKCQKFGKVKNVRNLAK